VDDFTKKQQDYWFDEGLCPFCCSDDCGASMWSYRVDDCRYRECGCRSCEQVFFEMQYLSGGPAFLTKALEDE